MSRALPSSDDPFALHPGLDPVMAARTYAETGRVELRPFLVEGAAEALRAHLTARCDWSLVMNAGDKVYEMSRAAATTLSTAQRESLERKLGAAAVHGFQYRYETIRVPDKAEARVRSPALLDRFADFLNAPPVLDLLRVVAGEKADFVDAQATAYGPGHFLTRHDDAVVGKHRVAAYVYGLTVGWRAEWGGLLLFHGDDEAIEHGFVPAFNALRLFRVPALHSVSHVWPFAPEPRLSVTGWLRRR